MPLPSMFDAMNAALKEMQIQEILELNQVSTKYGLTLTPAEVTEIITARNQTLQSYGRVELDLEIIRKLILTFCDSTLIAQEDYTATLEELLEVFYYLKNETDDTIGDDALLGILKNYFETTCGGSLDLLRGQELDQFVRDFKRARAVAYPRRDEYE